MSQDQTLLLVMAGLTMFIGVLGAVAQAEVRRILAFHSVSQIGYIVMGFALFTSASLAAAIFFILHHSLVKANLFLISGVIQRRRGSTKLKELGNLTASDPLLAVLFLVTALSLAGIPPLTGFWAKLGLVQAGLKLSTTSAFAVIAVSLVVSVFTLISMVKIWIEAFWKPAPDARLPASPNPTRGVAFVMYGPILFLTAVTLGLGLAPEPLLTLAFGAADQLLDRGDYVRAVLGVDLNESLAD
jgi:multicomponent Na+:H+ antiporter subunit D